MAVQHRAVIFDLGGVVFPSPFDAFADYEVAAGLPPRFIREVVAATGDTGAWARLERGECTFDEFCPAFEQECRTAGGAIVAADVLAAITHSFEPRGEMIDVIVRVRDAGLRTAALTNNWVNGNEEHLLGDRPRLVEIFDVIIESTVVGVRKPDPRIYSLTCEQLGVVPHECVFLDDLGVNLKPAREMGMHTIKVVDPAVALEELEAILGLPPTGEEEREP